MERIETTAVAGELAFTIRVWRCAGFVDRQGRSLPGWTWSALGVDRDWSRSGSRPWRTPEAAMAAAKTWLERAFGDPAAGPVR
jgi:hypothetical protein